MATFSINEDGTLNFIPERVPYNPSEESYGSINHISRGGRKSSGTNKPTRKFDGSIYRTRVCIDIIIQKFAEYGKLISEETVQSYLPKLSESLRGDFIEAVAKHNERMAAIPLDARMRMGYSKVSTSSRESTTTQSKKTKPSKSLTKSHTKKARKAAAKAEQAKIQAQLEKIQQETSKLMIDVVQMVHETGSSTQIGNFKISKLK